MTCRTCLGCANSSSRLRGLEFIGQQEGATRFRSGNGCRREPSTSALGPCTVPPTSRGDRTGAAPPVSVGLGSAPRQRLREQAAVLLRQDAFHPVASMGVRSSNPRLGPGRWTRARGQRDQAHGGRGVAGLRLEDPSLDPSARPVRSLDQIWKLQLTASWLRGILAEPPLFRLVEASPVWQSGRGAGKALD